MEYPVGLWIDMDGQYHAYLLYEGTCIEGVGATTLAAFLGCWEIVALLVAVPPTVSDTSRPCRADVSEY